MNKSFYSPVIRLSAISYWLLACNFASAQFTKAELTADGLTCSLCTKAIDKELSTLNFIDSIHINVSNSLFILYFKPNTPVDFNAIKKKVKDAGFSVGALKTTYRFNNLMVDSINSFNLQGLIFYFINEKPKTLNGEMSLQFIDAGFVSDKEFKKYAHQISVHPYNKNGQVYHVIL